MSALDTTPDTVLLEGFLHLKHHAFHPIPALYASPDHLLESGVPVSWGQHHDEPRADEDDAGQLHVTEHHLIDQDVIGWKYLQNFFILHH